MTASLFRFSLLTFLFVCGVARADDKKVELAVGDKAPAFTARTDADAT